MRPAFLALAVGLLVAACAASEDTTTTTVAAATTTTTTAPPTTMSTTTTIPAGEVFLLIDQPLRLIVTTPEFVISGTTTPGATVIVGDVETSTSGDARPAAFFEVPVTLEPGTSEVIVIATDDAGTQATAFMSITYVPDATEEFGFLIEVGPDELTADYADFLTGEEANEAAIAAGEIEEGESVPNDYFIRNVNPQLRTLLIPAPPVVVVPTSETGAVTEVDIPFVEWLGFFDDGRPWPLGEAPFEEPFFLPGAEGAPYWLTIVDGSVVQIRQQYLP